MNLEGVATFLYMLMRDHLTPGVVEGIMANHIELNADYPRVFSNPHLEAHAREIAARLADCSWPARAGAYELAIRSDERRLCSEAIAKHRAGLNDVGREAYDNGIAIALHVIAARESRDDMEACS